MSGFDDLTGTVEEGFKDVLRQRGRRRKKQWNDYYVQDLWQELLAEGIPGRSRGWPASCRVGR